MAGACAASAAASVTVAPRQPRFVYTATGRRLTDMPRDLDASQSVPAVLADGIDGVVSASFDISPREFLDAMSKAYGILWHQEVSCPGSSRASTSPKGRWVREINPCGAPAGPNLSSSRRSDRAFSS